MAAAGGAFAHPEYLVDTEWLAKHLDDADLRVFDCTTVLVPDPVTTFRYGAISCCCAGSAISAIALAAAPW